MSKTIAIANQKGGVGKTTICQHLSYALAELGHNVLCVDFDPQTNLTASLLHENTNSSNYDISNLMTCLLEDQELPPSPDQYIVCCGKVDLIAGSKNLSRLESILLTEAGTEFFLRQIISNLQEIYDYIFIDTNRANSPLMDNALTAADSVLIPICPEFFSTEGLADLITTTLKNRKRLNSHLKFEGIVFSRCNLRTNLYRNIRADVEETFANEIPVFRTAIPDTVKVGDAISRGLTIIEYAPDSKASKAYREFAKELIEIGQSETAAKKSPLHVFPNSGGRRVS